MRTTRRLLIVPAILVLLVSCGSDKGSGGVTTTAARATTVGPDTTGDEKPVSGDAAEIVVKVARTTALIESSRSTRPDGRTAPLSDDDEDYTVEGYNLEGKAAAVSSTTRIHRRQSGQFKVSSKTSGRCCS
jgi:hypothetical protein